MLLSGAEYAIANFSCLQNIHSSSMSLILVRNPLDRVQSEAEALSNDRYNKVASVYQVSVVSIVGAKGHLYRLVSYHVTLIWLEWRGIPDFLQDDIVLMLVGWMRMDESTQNRYTTWSNARRNPSCRDLSLAIYLFREIPCSCILPCILHAS